LKLKNNVYIHYDSDPIAYNAAQTYLDKNEVKDYKKGLIPALFGSRRITTTTFKHNILTPEQQNQLFQIEMRRRGYNPDGTSITGGAGNSADAEKAAADAATVVEQVSKDEAEKAAAERAAQGLPPETATDQSNIPTDQEIIPTPSDSKKSQMPITSALSYKFYGSEDPLDAEQQQVKKQEQQTMLTDDLGPSAFTTENLTFNPNTETYTIDDLVQEQNNPNTTGNNS